REGEQITLPTVLQTRNSSKGSVHFSATFGSVPARIQRRSIFARGPMSTLPRHAAGVRIALAIALLSAEVLPSAAQEIIVDKRSARARAERVAEEVRPAVLFRKRADSLVQALLVVDDTRNAETRLDELKAALESLDAAAKRSPGVRVALVVE